MLYVDVADVQSAATACGLRIGVQARNMYWGTGRSARIGHNFAILGTVYISDQHALAAMLGAWPRV